MEIITMNLRKNGKVISTARRRIPSGPEDLSRSQKLDIITAHSLTSKTKAPTAAYQSLLEKWLNTPNFHDIDPAHLKKLIDLIDWAKPDALGPHPIFPTYEGYKSIEDKFADANNLEYAVADEKYTQCMQAKDQDTFISALHELSCVLYRPRVTGKDKKITYPAMRDRDDINTRLKTIANWPDKIHLSSLYYFSNIKTYIDKLYGRWLFDDPQGDPEDKEARPAVSSGPKFGWWGTFLDIAETGVFGNFDQVLQQNFHNTCMYLVQKKDAYLKQKSKSKG